MIFPNMKIQNKLTVLLMVMSSLTVLFACMLFYMMVSKQFLERYKNDLQNLSIIVGENCKAALLFDVADDAIDILSSFKYKDSIQSVELYDDRENLFAKYPDFPPSQKSTLPNRSFNSSDRSTLKVSTDITLENGTKIGKLFIVDDKNDRNIS